MERAWITSRDVALHLSVVPSPGAAGTVVFVPGIASHAGIYSSLVPGVDLLASLAAEGLNVVALDLQGHGRSAGRRGHLPFREALANIAEAVGYAGERFGLGVGVLGSSLGGILALYAALEDQRVRAVLCHNAADLRDVASLARRMRQRAAVALGERIAALAARAPYLPAPVSALLSPSDVFEDPETVRRWRRAPGTVWRYTLESFATIFFTPAGKPALEAVDTPLLLATGEEDPIFSVAAQRRIVERVSGPAELWVLEGAGHMLPLEHAAAFVPRAGEWFRKTLG